ncbi:MAG TPA: stage II sporulation protein M [Anaerolineae bacterium]|nr:stage II sporulation protein M [Anaerolineae bacterium]
MQTDNIFRSILRALRRAWIPILTFALTYLIAVLIGIFLVHTGNAFALSSRDNIIANAQTSSILQAIHTGNRLHAALLDFGANLFAACTNTISGLTIIVPYPVAAYRGWVIGIVSVDSAHLSRLADPSSAFYYILTVILQLIPYSLAGGAGVNLGLAYLRPRPSYQGEKWLGLPKEAIRDTLRIYILVLPLFLGASLWEFLAA